eukprot:2578262-Rhodomonas_salina.3
MLPTQYQDCYAAISTPVLLPLHQYQTVPWYAATSTSIPGMVCCYGYVTTRCSMMLRLGPYLLISQQLIDALAIHSSA